MQPTRPKIPTIISAIDVTYGLNNSQRRFNITIQNGHQGIRYCTKTLSTPLKEQETLATFEQITRSAMEALTKQPQIDDKTKASVVSKLRLIAEHTKEKHFSGLLGTIKELFIRCISFLKGRGFCTPVDTVLNFCNSFDRLFKNVAVATTN